jgi:sugar/nucleoside kinase (ribokinase family)
MIQEKIIISGTGCALADFLYNRVSFSSNSFVKYLSHAPGDGGLSPGKLVFTEELEKYAGRPYPEIIKEIIVDRAPDAFNVGGPSLVSLIHASQLLESGNYEVRFFGMAGKDTTAEKIFEMVRKTPLNIANYKTDSLKNTAFTHVLSDPDYENGHGERTFVNNIGAAWDYTPEMPGPEFFESHIVCFGGTALVPQLHDNLTSLLARARRNKCITVVNTVFDFRNEKSNPGKPWPLVNKPGDLGTIDLLIMDREEALRISGRKSIAEAAGFFSRTAVGSFIITHGAEELTAWSQGTLFEKSDLITLPVSAMVTDKLRTNPRSKGDTTGCGDNFAGGLIASLAWQLKTRAQGNYNLTEALSWGVASGGLCCFTVGGTYLESSPGEKRKEVQHIQAAYLDQIRS